VSIAGGYCRTCREHGKHTPLPQGQTVCKACEEAWKQQFAPKPKPVIAPPVAEPAPPPVVQERLVSHEETVAMRAAEGLQTWGLFLAVMCWLSAALMGFAASVSFSGAVNTDDLTMAIGLVSVAAAHAMIGCWVYSVHSAGVVMIRLLVRIVQQ